MQELTVKELQKIEFEMLIDFDKVCRKHQLRYSLIYGTMLGAIRHKGFIPWDDDIDIMMPRVDYERLLALPANEFKAECEVWEHRKTKGYVHPIAKLVHTKTELIEKLNLETIQPLGVYLDIFPADKIPQSTEEQQALYQRCLKNSQKLALSVLRFIDTGNPLKNILKKLGLFYYHKKGPQTYLKRFDAIVEDSQALTSDTLKILAFPEAVPNELSVSEFDHMIEQPFEQGNFYIVSCYERLLKANYGDYMQLPKEELRVSNHDTRAYWKNGQE